jgi:hypothetical protein
VTHVAAACIDDMEKFATLLLELYDSVSGEILARAVDRRVAGQTAFMQWTDKMANRAAAREVLADWAGLLRKRLDEIQGDSQKSD